ncbi:MAG: FAD-dependent monooxygenase [Planctomycetales bacterium]|nr:FAD-dependent monooxygenase [Planctomycetales bacterium]
MIGPTTQPELWDVLVIGAGPAGSAAAMGCVRAGLQVLLVDAKRFPRRKVCGGCLNRVSYRMLQELLGAEHPLWKASCPLDSVRLTHGRRHFVLPMPAGVAVDRQRLDSCLVQAAEREGVVFRAPLRAQLLPVAGERRAVALTTAGATWQVSARAVVLASGLGGRAATQEPSLLLEAGRTSRVGIEAIFERFPENYHRGAVHMVVGRQGYVGLTQLEGKRLHVAAAVDVAALQRLGPAELCQAILRQAGAPPLLEDPRAQWQGTPPLTARPNCRAAERVFLVGDAAGYVEPFTGEGIRWAVHSGLGVAPLAVAAQSGWNTALASRWEHWYRHHIVPEQRLCRHLAAGLKQPPLRWLAHHALRWGPQLASRIISQLNHESK